MRESVAKRLGFGVMASAFLIGSAVMIGAPNTSAHEGVAHPAHVHEGTCPTPGDVVFPLTDVAEATGDATGSDNAVPVDVSETTIKAALSDLVDGNHAIVVHESADNIGNYILCGDIGGHMVGDSDLPIGLAELNESGAAGVALLHDNGDGTTDVEVYVTEKETSAAGTPEVSIKDFSFGDPIEVAVGTTVTWTNNDTSPHTATSDDGTFQSGKIDPGASFSFTFDTAGTYEYHCEFHANMHGTITVK
jgi:plastocyanin